MRLFLLLSFVVCSSSLVAFWGWEKDSRAAEVRFLRKSDARERALVWQKARDARRQQLAQEDSRLIELAGSDRCVPSCIARLSKFLWG